MLNKQIMRSFFFGFLSAFRFGSAKLAQKNYKDIATYVLDVEDYINTAYIKLKNDNERN
ncbi:MAG: hypothetical protein AB8B68_02760 [Rickettsiaceae bacterium]